MRKIFRRGSTMMLFIFVSMIAAWAEDLRSCWQADRISGEPLLFVQGPGDALAKADLLRVPAAPPALRNAEGDKTFQLGRDFNWKPGEREVVLTTGSSIPHLTYEQLHLPPGSEAGSGVAVSKDGKSWLLYAKGPNHVFHDLQVAADYGATLERIFPDVPVASHEQLGRLRDHLRKKELLTLVILGDSISTELNSSSTGGVPPYQRGYVGLVAAALHARFESELKVLNLSVGGKTSLWGLEQTDAVIGAKPDLLIYAFGMNDASQNRTADEFAETVSQTLQRIRHACPNCAIIIVTPMSANPEWSGAAPGLYPAYAVAMEKLAGPGIAVANVTAVWSAVVERKKFLDLTGNGLNHPNDFGHRIYADVILATIGGLERSPGESQGEGH